MQFFVFSHDGKLHLLTNKNNQNRNDEKYILDLNVVSVEPLSDKHILIKLTDEKPLPEILPGQFVEVRVDHSPTTMLRRPISVNL